MKNKNTCLALLAFSFGVSGGFSSLYSPQPVYVKAMLFESAEWACYDVKVSCQTSGISICSVIVPLRSGSTSVASTDAVAGQPLVYSTGCVQVRLAATDEYSTAPLVGNERPLSLLR